jgi:hypothetical protein
MSGGTTASLREKGLLRQPSVRRQLPRTSRLLLPPRLTVLHTLPYRAVSPQRQRNGVKVFFAQPKGPGRGCAAKIVAHKINKFKLNFGFLRNWKVQIVYHDNVKSAQFLLHKKAFYGPLAAKI